MVREPDLDSLLLDYEREFGKVVSLDSFQKDINRFSTISKLCRRYIRSGSLNSRLILNHIIILNNLFPNNYERILLNNSDPEVRPVLNAFLVYRGLEPSSYCEETLKLIESDIG